MSKPVQRERVSENTVSWSSTQAYSLAVACLLLGVALGYLLRGSAPANAVVAAPVAAASLAPGQMPGMGGMPGSNGMTTEQIDQAAQPLLQAISRNPKDAEAIARLGNFYYDAHQYSKAVEYYGQVLKLHPENVDVRTDMATAIWYSGNADVALVEYEKSLKYQPNHAGALFNLGIVKWQGKADRQGAVQAWEKVLKVNPDYAEKQHVRELIAKVQQDGGRGGAAAR